VKVVRRRDARPPAPAPGGAAPHRGGGQGAVVALAASTGGPAALQRILIDLPRTFPAPVLVVQHLAAGFVQGLARWLGGSCELHVKVAEHGEALSPGTVYVAPDALHLGMAPGGRVALSDLPPEGSFRPSATHLFRSAGEACGPSLVAVILTGMGRDGVDGLRTVRALGGHVLAQDEATSVVFGMPGEAVQAGVVDAVVPVEQIAGRLVSLVQGE
jgi:two-component system chemotaxis response regulator CheB